jgi:hypothetical protein
MKKIVDAVWELPAKQHSNSNWIKILGFRNMQEKLENVNICIWFRVT